MLRAVQLNDEDRVRELVAAGEDVNQVGRNGLTPLLWATVRDNRVLIRLFVEAGADVNAMMRGGLSALFDVVSHGDVENLDLLLSRGANARHKNERGEGVLKRVESCRLATRFQLMARLIDAGADPNNRNKYGHPDLYAPFILGEDDDDSCRQIFALLARHRFDFRRVEDGQTLLHAAATCNSVEAARLLLQRKVNLRTRERRNGDTALHFATAHDHRK